MSDDHIAIPQYNPITGSELAKLVALEVERLLLEDCHLKPAIAYKLFKLEFELKLYHSSSPGNLPDEVRVRKGRGYNKLKENEKVVESVVEVEAEIGPNDAPDDLRVEHGMEVPK